MRFSSSNQSVNLVFWLNTTRFVWIQKKLGWLNQSAAVNYETFLTVRGVEQDLSSRLSLPFFLRHLPLSALVKKFFIQTSGGKKGHSPNILFPLSVLFKCKFSFKLRKLKLTLKNFINHVWEIEVAVFKTHYNFTVILKWFSPRFGAERVYMLFVQYQEYIRLYDDKNTTNGRIRAQEKDSQKFSS